jgi:hypothetical protein
MSIERWGAFSVIDHKDAKKLAAEVILYDRLILPQPVEWDRKRWEERGWDPNAMDSRIRQLGELAIGVNWDLDREKEWRKKMDSLGEDAKNINAGYQQTPLVLMDYARKYRPAGEGAVEPIRAYQSEVDFRALDLKPQDKAAEQTAQFNCLVAHAILIPDGEDSEECLKRAIDLAAKDKFVQRRRRFYDWQRQILAQGIAPKDAIRELEDLVREYNEAVASSGRSYRIETAMLVVALSAVALAATAAIVPGAFAAVGIGAFTGAQVTSLGSTTTGGIIQLLRHVRGRREPDDATRKELSGAMFHQLEQETGWKLAPLGKPAPR